MIPTFVDVETAYSVEYSLQRMSTAQYVLDPRFELICASVIEGLSGTPVCYWGPDAADYLRSLDWSQRMMISHNIKFDASVLAWRLGIRPAFYMCTMALAQVMAQPYCGSASLKDVCAYIGAPPKGDEVVRAKGKWLKDFTPEEARAYMAYCNNDNLRAIDVWRAFARSLPPGEARIIDDMCRMFVEPVLQLDVNALMVYRAQEQDRKENLLSEAGLTDRSHLMSDERLAGMLSELGVDPPLKYSSTQQRSVYAFAKTDEAFTDLLDDEDPLVSSLVAARLGHKSTIEETRAGRLIDVGSMTSEHWFPVPLRYGAAITHRAGGTDFINVQNFRRGGEIRRAIVAPPGHRIVTVDASQIELRCLMWLARQTEMLRLFEEGRNAYIEFGQTFYQRTIDKAQDLEAYTLAKICVLSCGYAVGGSKFRRTARAQTNGLIRLTEVEAATAVATYRNKYYMVPRFWRRCQDFIRAMHDGTSLQWMIDGHVIFSAAHQYLQGPGDLPMVYPSLRVVADTAAISQDPEYVYDYGRRKAKRLFGPKLTENMCQHLGRLIVYAAHLRIKDRTGLRPALQAHDELVYVVPDSDVAALKPILVEEMSRRPAWAPGLPLAAEAHDGLNYRDAK